jgi:DNA-binding LacI/PurR family transcriptional regulator
MSTSAAKSAPKRPTITDVARACNVSKTTVSRALNFPPDKCPLNEETRRRVVAKAEEIGYRPNWLAQSLSRQRTHLIGLLYAQALPPVSGHHAAVLRVLVSELQPKGYQLVFASAEGPVKDWGHLLRDRILDACLVLDSMPANLSDVITDSGIPSVVLNVRTNLPCPHVLMDDQGGAMQLTRHLLEQGHRRIAYYDDPESTPHASVGDRQAGYLAAMRAAGLAPACQVMCMPLERVPDQIRGNPEAPTAIVTYQHQQAIRLLRLLWQAGVHVPRDLSVATFNDVYPVDCFIPTLTTVRMPAEQMGRLAADLLLQQIESPEARMPGAVVLPEEVIVRESTAAPRTAST